MKKERHVSFEVAKKLKEIGWNQCFDEYGNEHWYSLKTNSGELRLPHISKPYHEEYCCAPTHQMVLEWLRTTYQIYIEMTLYNPLFPFEFEPIIYTKNPDDNFLCKNFIGVYKEDEYYKGLDDAILEAIKIIEKYFVKKMEKIVNDFPTATIYVNKEKTMVKADTDNAAFQMFNESVTDSVKHKKDVWYAINGSYGKWVLENEFPNVKGGEFINVKYL